MALKDYYTEFKMLEKKIAKLGFYTDINTDYSELHLIVKKQSPLIEIIVSPVAVAQLYSIAVTDRRGYSTLLTSNTQSIINFFNLIK